MAFVSFFFCCCCSYNILASFWGCFSVLRRLISVFYKQQLNHYNTFRLPVFFHKLLEISPSGLGSETETSSQRVFLRTKSVIWGDLSGCQGLWVGFKVDTFKFLCRQKKHEKINQCSVPFALRSKRSQNDNKKYKFPAFTPKRKASCITLIKIKCQKTK